MVQFPTQCGAETAGGICMMSLRDGRCEVHGDPKLFVSRLQTPIVGFGAASNTLAESGADAGGEPVPSAGVVTDRLAMALAHALEHLRAEVPNHDPVRVEARKALDSWVTWSAQQAADMAADQTEGRTARSVAEWYERCPTCGSYEVVRRLTTQPHGPGTSFRFCDDEWRP